MAAFDIDELVKVGPDSPACQMMRQYWIPAGKSSELVAGGGPVRVLLLGEKLLAFRDPEGQVGVIDHMCPHRGASLFYGRNEVGGMRCVYHGWKFNREGMCTEFPTLPAGKPTPNIRTTAYKVEEANGIFWVYMGDREVPPPLPIFAHHNLDAVFVVRDCNWLQALEGDIDTSHVGFLHFGGITPDDLPDGHPSRIRQGELAPEFEVAQTAWGNMGGAYRDCGAEGRYWSVAHYLYPFWTITANDSPLSPPYLARAWVPLDDTHTLLVTMIDRNDKTGVIPEYLADKFGIEVPGTSFNFGTPLPNTTGWLGRWRIAENMDNDHMLDRDLQNRSTFVGADGGCYTGIRSILAQDQSITESQGPIQDRTKEHLIHGDMMIVRTRRLLHKTAEDWVEKGIVPPGVDTPGSFYGARGGMLAVEDKSDFVNRYMEAQERTATFKKAYDAAPAPVDGRVEQDA